MLGAIAGDIIGSVFELHPVKTTQFELFTELSHFTDDTVLTVAVANCILYDKDYNNTFKEYGIRYPNAGYGSGFWGWLKSKDSKPYYSYGNGSAMRVSPVGLAFDSISDVLKEAEKSAAVTHNHPEGIKGAQATAAAVFLARTGKSKSQIKDYIQKNFGYNLEQILSEIRPTYKFDGTCQGTVPQAIIAFLESLNYEDAVRKAVSLGGDSDTLACITGSIAGAFYKEIPESIVVEARKRLDGGLISILDEFDSVYGVTAE